LKLCCDWVHLCPLKHHDITCKALDKVHSSLQSRVSGPVTPISVPSDRRTLSRLSCCITCKALDPLTGISFHSSSTTPASIPFPESLNTGPCTTRDWFHLYPGDKGIPKAPLVGISDFVNVKVASKLMKQLQDPLMLSTGSLPPWCAELIVGCHFLFPIECRDFYTGCTAFGISRALHSMQQRVQGSSPSDRPTEVRIGRIQRQKIRVSRGRLLTSAMRALELYAGHRSMIEVEYYGEAGTGLGPTLEFYTLVSQELQVSSASSHSSVRCR
jgi:hypothetical protein